jgi:hypothetical protein
MRLRGGSGGGESSGWSLAQTVRNPESCSSSVPFEDGGVGRQLFASAHKDTNDKDTHFDRLFAAEDVGGHQCSVLRKGVRQVFDILSPVQGHNL